MRNFSLNDFTQQEIIPHLKVTEQLIEDVILKISNKHEKVEITALPDLGLSHNIVRMRGGFFTGMYLKWETNIPFIPVDTTVNSCGVNIYELNDTIDNEELFYSMINNAKTLIEKKGLLWNYNEGNHFIIYGLIEGEKPCIILHSSAKEYKSYEQKSLYPSHNSWYYKHIKIYKDKLSNRYLRYIEGTIAEKFYNLSKEAHEFNINRQREIANIMLGNNIKKELLNLQHYGMPSENEIAIGCSWNTDYYALLTAPNKNIFFVQNENKGLVPHGFGVISTNHKPSILYNENNIEIDGEKYQSGKINREKIIVRNSDLKEKEIYEIANRIVDKCNGKIIFKIIPVFSYDYMKTAH